MLIIKFYFLNFRRFFFFLFCFFLHGCSPSSIEDFREEGRAWTSHMVQELEKIHTREELIAKLPFIEREVEALVDLIIGAKTLIREEESSNWLDLTKEDHERSDSLRKEMDRLFSLEGGQELFEKAAHGPLEKLELFLSQRCSKT